MDLKIVLLQPGDQSALFIAHCRVKNYKICAHSYRSRRLIVGWRPGGRALLRAARRSFSWKAQKQKRESEDCLQPSPSRLSGSVHLDFPTLPTQPWPDLRLERHSVT